MRIVRRLRRDGERRAAGCRYRILVPQLRHRRRFLTPAVPQAEDGDNGILLLPLLPRLLPRLLPQGRVAPVGLPRFRRRRLPQITAPANRIKIIQFPSRIPVVDGGGNNGNPMEPITALPLRAALGIAGLRTRRPPHRRIRHRPRQRHKAHRSSSSRRTHTTVRSTAGNGGTRDKINHQIQLPLTHPRIKQATARHRRDHRAPITFSHSAERRWMKS